MTGWLLGTGQWLALQCRENQPAYQPCARMLLTTLVRIAFAGHSVLNRMARRRARDPAFLLALAAIILVLGGVLISLRVKALSDTHP